MEADTEASSDVVAPVVEQIAAPADDILSLFGPGTAAIPDVSIPSFENAAGDDDFELDLVPFSLDEITGVVAPSHEVDDASLAARSAQLLLRFPTSRRRQSCLTSQ